MERAFLFESDDSKRALLSLHLSRADAWRVLEQLVIMLHRREHDRDEPLSSIALFGRMWESDLADPDEPECEIPPLRTPSEGEEE